MGSDEERRCGSLYKRTIDTPEPMRCVLWALHSGKTLHRGFDEYGIEVHWEGKDAWQPVEDRRLGQEPRPELPEELDRWVSPVAARKIHELESELRSAKRRESERVSELMGQRDEAQREARAVRNQMSAEDRERLKMGQELREAREYIADLEAGADLPLTRARIEALEAELERWKTRNRELNSEAGRLQGERDDWKRAVDDLTRANLTLVKQRDTEARNAMTLVRQLQELQEELEQWKVSRDKARFEAQNAQARVRELEAREYQITSQAEVIRRQREQLYGLKHPDSAEA